MRSTQQCCQRAVFKNSSATPVVSDLHASLKALQRFRLCGPLGFGFDAGSAGCGAFFLIWRRLPTGSAVQGSGSADSAYTVASLPSGSALRSSAVDSAGAVASSDSSAASAAKCVCACYCCCPVRSFQCSQISPMTEEGIGRPNHRRTHRGFLKVAQPLPM